MEIIDKTECLFCSPENLAVIHESQFFRAVYNKYPTVEGHSMIITKRHIESLLDLTVNEWGELKEMSKILIGGLFRTFTVKSFDYAVQEGLEAGGSIDHFHIHVIPRKFGDLESPDDWYPELVRQRLEPTQRKKVELSLEEMRNMARKIEDNIKA